MPPRGVKSSKRKRQYEHIKESAKKTGRGKRASEIAARTVNKQRRKSGEAKTAPRRGTAGKTSRKKSTSTRGKSGSTRSRSSSSRSRGSSGGSRKSASRAKR